MKTTTIFQKTSVIFAMFVFVVFAFNACSTDDDPDPPTPVVADAVVGTWETVSVVATGNASFPLIGNVTVNGVGSNFNDCKLVITENPNNCTSTGTFDIHLDSNNWLFQDINLTAFPFEANGTWSRSGAVLTYTIKDVDVTAGDMILDNNDRDLTITFEELHGGINVEYTVKFTRIDPNDIVTVNWIKTTDVFQYGGADWSNEIQRVQGITVQEAMEIGESNLDIGFFCYAKSTMNLASIGHEGVLNEGDVVFFSGSPWYGDISTSDGYHKE